jgi:acyl-[acyl-carrier-protein]-phospholipid O-acyltransferase / long-chain-fatty-acid--[acyl-carrier-protein] ligase
MPGIQYKILPVPGIAEGGVLCVSGPNIMQGYLLANQPGVIIPPENGWYNTGDIVTIDEMGFITIKGRVKRFAKIAGEMISLVMVEQYIYKLWPDHQHAVVSLPDTKKGEQLVLVTTNPTATREEVVSYAKTCKMADIAIPKKILILPDMPILVTGKVDYTGVKERVNELLVVDEDEEDLEEEYES